MNKFVAQIIKEGRITIPIEVRELLGLKEGDYIDVQVEKVKTK